MATYTMASFSITGGEAQPMAPYIRLWEDRLRDGIDAVYGLVEVVSGPATTVSDIVWEALDEGLNAQRRLTTTRYLQSAIESAQSTLSEYSVRGWRASAVLAALTGNEVYLAWAGPAVSWVVTSKQVYYPGYVTPGNPGGALGEEGEVPIYVANEQIDDGDTIVIGWSQMPEVIEEEHVSTIIKSGIDPAMRSLYRMAAQESEFAMLMLQLAAA